jgi:hypothetical protein
MTLVEHQELVRAARKRLDEERQLLHAEVIQGRMTQGMADRFAGVRQAIYELSELRRSVDRKPDRR